MQLTLPTLIIKRNHGKEGGGTSTSVLLVEWFKQDISTLVGWLCLFRELELSNKRHLN